MKNPIPFNPATMTVSELTELAELVRMIFQPLCDEADGKISTADAADRIIGSVRGGLAQRLRRGT